MLQSFFLGIGLGTRGYEPTGDDDDEQKAGKKKIELVKEQKLPQAIVGSHRNLLDGNLAHLHLP